MDGPVFGALADPTRRHLLDLLFERDGRTLGELVAAVPGMTRFGVMKHLRVLESADLVTTRRVGREKLHYLNPVPIRRLHDRWLDKYRVRAADSLLDLKWALERPGRPPAGPTPGSARSPGAAPPSPQGEPMTTTAAAPAFVSSIYIRATPEAIWRAITETDFTSRYYYGSAIESAFAAGSPYTMTIDGAVQIEGTILEADPPRRLVQTFHALWDPSVAADAPTTVTWEIEETQPGVCRLTLVHDSLVTGSATLEQVSGGWPFILSGLKTLLETGTALAEHDHA
ncbi:MAG TPA: SRPBCC domain-containing protein [Patescibacteria group bacterium]|nr:SRPBCC domain-containing protein [Patescibacteria group bacterium]